ncbi:MAG: MBOAT family protein [Deltaproteobacteria bacterium]|jgi:D-alanyl-lipoteichoic acid acyltransferase DltB (MBOAT superfamily)|nr:MBOAT family protein [Deltaproteobacteria bacterium]MBW2530794.1 MBOAT family protein [Deltaproteobacteria bacterium]
MLFNSTEYAFLLAGAFAAYWLLAGHRRLRVLALLAASYLFYASWNARYLGLIFFSSTLDFAIGRAMSREPSPAARRALLAASVLVNLGILCTFKYFNFFAREAAALLAVFGVDATPFHLDVLLPVGISFYTFQTLSYTIDVYRRRLEPSASYTDYLLFVSFFPQLVAGPIVRASTLLPQIAGRHRLTAEQGSNALLLIGIGLAKKIAIADFLGVHVVDRVFTNPEMYSSLEALAAAYGYSFQIYADFSAYSDIAIGSAALLGFTIPLNFDAPYRAVDLRDFWRRWHISLSTWLRDYLYIPLGGSRRGPGRTYINLAVTMLLGGLWHGAALTFVVWGAIHGLALALTRAWQRAFPTEEAPSDWRRALGTVLTFHLVTAAWVFFRAPSFDVAFDVFAAIGALSPGLTNLGWPSMLVLALAVATHWIPDGWMDTARRGFHAAPAPLQAATLVAAVLALHQVASTEVTPFIYFQF